ncbi:MAG: phosphotransferase [Pseudomonadota bacterium]
MTDPLAQAIERQAEKALKNYNFSCETKFSLLSESENKVYLIDDPNRPENYVMRVNSGRLAYHTPLSIASELMWLIAIENDTDIVVPSVMKAQDGSLVQTLSAADLDKPRHAAIYSYLPGLEPSEDDLLPGFERLGAISARMHKHTKSWRPPNDFIRHCWLPEAILENRLNWGKWQNGVDLTKDAIALLNRLGRTLQHNMSDLERDRDRFGLIHADLRLANLLVQNDSTAIIDFDDCGYGWFLFDLAGALSFLEERPDVPDLIARWLEGYRRISPIPQDMEAAIPTFIMLRRIQLLGWVGYQQQHLEFARQIGPGFTRETCRLAEDYLQSVG